MKRVALFLIITLTLGCTKNPVTAPVPGTINTFDAYAARTIGDAQAALQNAKGWEMCSDQKFPPTVSFDNVTIGCDASSGSFPAAGRPYLFKAEQSYDIALAAAQSYHAGATNDTAGLTQALTQLGVDVGNMLSGIGKAR